MRFPKNQSGFFCFNHFAFGSLGPRRSAFGFLGLKRSAFGFTLAELLIALAILGVIATFTIPKVLQAQQNKTWNAIGKETAAMFSQAVERMRLEGTLSSTVQASDLTPYLNYVSMDTSTDLDDIYNQANPYPCSAANPCIRLHNGAMVLFWGPTFSGTGSLNAIWLQVDPDGKVTTDGSAQAPGKSVRFAIYYNGTVRTRETILPGTSWGGSFRNPTPGTDPDWFGWG